MRILVVREHLYELLFEAKPVVIIDVLCSSTLKYCMDQEPLVKACLDRESCLGTSTHLVSKVVTAIFRSGPLISTALVSVLFHWIDSNGSRT